MSVEGCVMFLSLNALLPHGMMVQTNTLVLKFVSDNNVSKLWNRLCVPLTLLEQCIYTGRSLRIEII